MKKNIPRRLFLKGAGSVLIGIPLLEESFAAKAFAATSTAALPTRLITMSFGLGIEKALQAELWNGPLEPLKPLANKMAMFSNLRNEKIRGDGSTPHVRVGGALLTGVKQNGESRAGGSSLEQLARLTLHPNGVPSLNGLPSKSAGIWSRTLQPTQYTRHWNSDGSPGERPERRPSKVFASIFGSIPPSGETPGTDTLASKMRRSVLDSVVDQYKTLVAPSSYLGQDSKERINTHLETIRSIELELAGADSAATQIEAGELPIASDYKDPTGISFYDAKSGALTGPTCTWQSAQQAFRLMGDLYVLALKVDALRFGSLIFVGAGEHIRFSGTYNATNIGKSLDFTKTFATRSPHDGIFHNHVPDSIRVYQHYVVSQFAYVMQQMDAVVEPNGKTLLDNTCVVLGTEYGLNHEDTGNIFHAVVGGNGKFKAGQYNNLWGFEDVYKTVMDAYKIKHSIAGNTLSNILV
jgi:hypothetical protein